VCRAVGSVHSKLERGGQTVCAMTVAVVRLHEDEQVSETRERRGRARAPGMRYRSSWSGQHAAAAALMLPVEELQTHRDVVRATPVATKEEMRVAAQKELSCMLCLLRVAHKGGETELGRHLRGDEPRVRDEILQEHVAIRPQHVRHSLQ
jgi:hypothetical protein